MTSSRRVGQGAVATGSGPAKLRSTSSSSSKPPVAGALTSSSRSIEREQRTAQQLGVATGGDEQQVAELARSTVPGGGLGHMMGNGPHFDVRVRRRARERSPTQDRQVGPVVAHRGDTIPVEAQAVDERRG